MHFQVGDIVKHKHNGHCGFVVNARKPIWPNYQLRDQQYNIIWFDEKLNDRANHGLLQIEHGDTIVKVTT